MGGISVSVFRHGAGGRRLYCLGFVSSVCLASSLLWASGSAPRLAHGYPRVQGALGLTILWLVGGLGEDL